MKRGIFSILSTDLIENKGLKLGRRGRGEGREPTVLAKSGLGGGDHLAQILGIGGFIHHYTGQCALAEVFSSCRHGQDVGSGSWELQVAEGVVGGLPSLLPFGQILVDRDGALQVGVGIVLNLTLKYGVP